ncbi:hypothetical protein MEQU1_003208 [Malassezia equina]|uniref:Sodium/calcium exchanger membrane region domain-containing protein n=1 Tax=Malassezia equina TaxID=1381935 RepID=A0AAF0EH26_9BASI|nr:hypothetical protein MEQU1_003208 [Malassezia equina]
MSAVRGVWMALARAAHVDAPTISAACAPVPPGISPKEACAALGLVASDFFCPNLSTIATRLGLSDSIVGVTLLALGNGFPDIISTFRAMEKNAGALALGELMGAAVFTVSMVCGSIMLVHQFTVPPAYFLRDVGTYTIAVLLVLFFLLDGTLGLGEGVCMLGLYLGYVATVCLGDLASPTDDETAPLLDRPIEVETPSAPPLGHHSLLSAARVHDLSRLSDTGLAVSGNMAHHVLDPTFTFRHPRLYRTMSQHSLERPFYRSPWLRPRPGRALTTDALRSPTSARLPRFFDQVVVSPSAMDEYVPDMPSPRTITDPAFAAQVRARDVSPAEPTPMPSIHIDRAPSTVPPGVAAMEEALARLQSPPEALTLWRLIVIAFFPSLLRWEHKSHFHHGVSVFCTPAFLVLRLTLPLVSHDEFLLHEGLERLRDAAADAEDEHGLWADIWDEVGSVLETPAPIVHTAERVAADHLLLCMNCVMTPLFVLWVAEAPWPAFPAAALVGSGAGGALWHYVRRTKERDAPAQLQLFALWRSTLGFVLGLVWIVVLVDSVLALLRALGYLFHWSEAILGLTLFALGNSLGDVVTNLSIARLGHPIMALTACFASPMTNLLLGIGSSATWLSLRHPTQGPYHITLSPALVLSSSVLLLMLVLMLVVLPLLHFRVNKYLGMCLLVTYVGVMIANILLELHANAGLV